EEDEPSNAASSAMRTARDARSASEYTATLRMPASRSARTIRTAISPRLATRTLPNMNVDCSRRDRSKTLFQGYDGGSPAACLGRCIRKGCNEWSFQKDLAHRFPLYPNAAPVNNPERLQP